MKYISLFSGCGGFDQGLMEAGWQCMFAVDNDEHALKIVGLRRRVGLKEAQRVLGMSDAELAAWYKENPALTSAVRAPALPSNGSSLSHPHTP